jgi:5-methylcytosine-specific restriction endonuclease McrA
MIGAEVMPGIGSRPYTKLDQVGTSRVKAKLQKRQEEADTIRACYAFVNERDGYKCRVCSRRGRPGAASLLDKLHHHHLHNRSLGGAHETANVVLLCSSHHSEVHVEGTLRLSGDADARDELHRLRGVKVERWYEAGWKVERWV